MTARTDYLSRCLSDYLERRAIPRNLHGNEKAQADEFAALVRSVNRLAPEENFQEWWPRLEDRLDAMLTTRAWPTVNEIRGAAKLVSKSGPVVVGGNEWSLDPLKISARRIKEKQAVGDEWIYGKGAAELVSTSAVSEEDLKPYRSSLFFSEKSVVGDDIALQRERERQVKHNDARQHFGLQPYFAAQISAGVA